MPLAGYLESEAHDLNVFGIVVGDSSNAIDDADPFYSAFVWMNGASHDLNALADVLPDIRLERATAINAHGQIVVCSRRSPTTDIVAILTPIGRPLGDVDSNCRTDHDDLTFVTRHWGESNSPADVDGSGVVDVDDLLVVLLNWTM